MLPFPRSGSGRVLRDRPRPGSFAHEGEWTLIAFSALAATITALLWVHARVRLERFAERLVHGERGSPDEVLRTFGSRLTRALPLDELLLQLAETLRRTLALQAAEVWTGVGGLLERAASDPERGHATLLLSPAEQGVLARAGVSGPAWMRVWLPALVAEGNVQLRLAPVCQAGELLGLLVVERPSTAEPFSDDDDRVLAELAREVGLALRNARLDSALQASLDELRRQAEELRASRARVVAAADAERRRIERNLHDGAQQYLVALAVNVRLARELAETDSEAARALLVQLGQDAQDAVDQIRELAHGIYPPLLLERGLVDALRAAASSAGIDARVEAGSIGRFPAEAEATVYFCCLEALQNAAKHAGGDARADIRVWEEQGGLRFEVADDGKGLDLRTQQRGAGLTNMADRIGALGGRLSVTSKLGGGTVVSGTIPLDTQ